mgnify:CR=1 FL=1
MPLISKRGRANRWPSSHSVVRNIFQIEAVMMRAEQELQRSSIFLSEKQNFRRFEHKSLSSAFR